MYSWIHSEVLLFFLRMKKSEIENFPVDFNEHFFAFDEFFVYGQYVQTHFSNEFKLW